MTDYKFSQKQMDEIDRYVNKWRLLLFLNEWEIRTRFMTESHSNNNSDRGDILASAEVDPVYATMVIRVFPELFENNRIAWQRESSIVHEMVHGVIEPMNYLVRKHQYGELVTAGHSKDVLERTVTHVTNIAFSIDHYLNLKINIMKEGKRARKRRR